MRKADLLAHLQRLDSALDQSRARLATIEAQLGDRSALEALEAEQHAERDALHRLQTEQRDLDLEVEGLRGSLAEVERKLYSGRIQNPKELGALVDDGQQIRGQISRREDRLIPLFDEIEAAQARLAETTAQVEAARRERAAQESLLQAEGQQLSAELSLREREREGLRAEADPASLRVYDSLRRSRGGLAVAEVAQQTCQGCRVSLPASMEQRARSSPDLVVCQSCGRILHAGR
jgi:predicted  nucleic acid-binding Zn-ribbon protein